MELVKVTQTSVTKKSKSGKEYHPHYFMLRESLPNGKVCKVLVNFPNEAKLSALLEALAIHESK